MKNSEKRGLIYVYSQLPRLEHYSSVYINLAQFVFDDGQGKIHCTVTASLLVPVRDG